MRTISTLAGYKPLAVTTDRVVFARQGAIYTSDHNIKNLRFLCKIPLDLKKRVLARFRISERILRLSVNTMVVVADRYGYLNTGSKIFLVDLHTGDINLDFQIPRGRKSLSLSTIPNPNAEGDAVAFGEYYSNHKGPMIGSGLTYENPDYVNIWYKGVPGSDGDSAPTSWSVLDKFEDYTVDHVHSVISGSDGQIYALIGDNGPNVGFWRWRSDRKMFEPHRVGKQLFRSTWAIMNAGEILYATDTNLEQNYLVSLGPGDGEFKKIAPLEGSSIYATASRGCVIFSTTVEPGIPRGSLLRVLFEKKLGPGILSDEAALYSYNYERGQLRRILTAKKDWLPPRLAQFGSFMLPSGMENLNGKILFFGNAISGYDNVCVLADLD